MCLFVCDRHVLTSTIDTDDEDGVPSNITRADIYVDVQINFEIPQDKDNKKRLELAEKVKATVEKKLKEYYTGEKGKAKYGVKVKVVHARQGSVWNAFTCGMSGSPPVVSLEWFFKTANGFKTYKSGRVTDTGMSHLCDQQYALEYQFPCRLVQEIIDKVGIHNQSATTKKH